MPTDTNPTPVNPERFSAAQKAHLQHYYEQRLRALGYDPDGDQFNCEVIVDPADLDSYALYGEPPTDVYYDAATYDPEDDQ